MLGFLTPLLAKAAGDRGGRWRFSKTGKITYHTLHPEQHRAVLTAPAVTARLDATWERLRLGKLAIAARAQIDAFAATGVTAVHPQLGTIKFSNRGGSKLVRGMWYSRDTLLLTPDLPRLLRLATLVKSAPPREPTNEPNVRAYHTLALKVRLKPSERPFFVAFVVREDNLGRFYYGHREEVPMAKARSADWTCLAVARRPAGCGSVPPKGSGHPRLSVQPALKGTIPFLFKSRKLHGRRWVNGLHVSIENRRGSVRHWRDHDGSEGTTKMRHPYGYVRESLGTDGDQIDAFLGPLARSGQVEGTTVYVVMTRKPPDFRELDENKAMIGYPTLEAARAAFLEHYGGDERFIAQIDALPWEAFKREVRATKIAGGFVRGNVVRRGPLVKGLWLVFPTTPLSPRPRAAGRPSWLSSC